MCRFPINGSQRQSRIGPGKARRRVSTRRRLLAKTLHYDVAIAQNGGILPLELSEDADLRDLPEQFVRRHVRYELNREAIREALDRGESLTFVRYGPRGNHLRIK